MSTVLKNLVRSVFASARKRRMQFDATPAAPGGIHDASQLAVEATASYRRGEVEDALALCARALEIDATQSQARTLQGAIALDRGELGRARATFADLIRLHPDHPDYLANAAEAERRAGNWNAALELAGRALAIRPDHGLASHVSAYAHDSLGHGDEAYHWFRRLLQADPANADVHSGLLSLLQRFDILGPMEVAAEHRAWGERHANALTPASVLHANSRDPERRLRIGYVSADLCWHAVGSALVPIVEEHDRDRFAIHFYSNGHRSDAVTARLRGNADGWREIAEIGDDNAAAAIREDCIDVLVDLSGHTAGNRLRLFARKPAPVQFTYLGYLSTTGVRAIDYRVSDVHADPPGASDAYYSERLLRLPYSQACYSAPPGVREVGDAPSRRREHVTFGSFNNFMKVNPPVVQAWGEILARTPTARLRILNVPRPESADWLLIELQRRGIARDRIDLLERLPTQQFLEEIRGVDIALDTFPQAGGTTTCDTLWMGAPVVTLAGRSGATRIAASILLTIGLDELVAADRAGYSDIAVRLAQDPARIEGYRRTLRERMLSAPFMQPARVARDLESLYRSAWREYCLGGAPA